MGNIKIEIIKTEDAEGFQSITLKYEGREVETWVDLLRAMQHEYAFDLTVSDDIGDGAQTSMLHAGEYRNIPVSEVFPDEQPSNEPSSVGVAQAYTDEPLSVLNSAMSPALKPEGFDEALEEVVKTLESSVEWTQVESSNLSAVAYQEDLQLLLVEFKKGEVYKYAGVPKGIFESLMSADSKGRFFAANIRDHFPHEKMEVKE